MCLAKSRHKDIENSSLSIVKSRQKRINTNKKMFHIYNE